LITEKQAMEVIFRGEKQITGVEAPLEFTLVNHKTFGVIEIVGYEKNKSMEANRLYVDSSLVCKEVGTEDALVATFLVNKLCISVSDPEMKRLVLSLSAQKPFVCHRPLGLKPFVLNNDVHHEGISQHDLRRIPELFARVNQGGEALGGADAELWATFTRSKSEMDVIKIVAGLLAEKLLENVEVVEEAVQAAVMPCNTPFPSHSEVAPLMSSRSFSDFAKMSLDDNNDDLMAMPPLVRTQSYGSSSPRSVPASPSHRKGELMVPSPSHRMLRAPLPRSGTSSSLSSPTARKSTSGIAEAVEIVEEEKSQSKQEVQTGHKRVRSLGVLDSLKDALSRSIGIQSSPTPGDRVDTASSSDSNFSQSRGIAVDAADGVSSHSIASSVSGSASSKKVSGGVLTPPVSPRPPLDTADIFPPHSAMHSRSNSFSSTNGGTSSRRHSFVTGQMVPCTPPPSAKKNAYSGLDCGSADSATNNNNFSPRLDEGVRSRTPSRASSPSLLRAFTNWGSSSSKVVPGGWEDENSF